MSDKETADIAYWERNMLALYLADGWYYDDIKGYDSELGKEPGTVIMGTEPKWKPRYEGWRRVLSCLGGQACFHIPDDFDVLNLPQIEQNWDGHSTPEKWERLAERIKDKWAHKTKVQLTISPETLVQLERFMLGGDTYDEALMNLMNIGVRPKEMAKRLTRAEVSEAISVCYQYGNEAIVNYLFGMPSDQKTSS